MSTETIRCNHCLKIITETNRSEKDNVCFVCARLMRRLSGEEANEKINDELTAIGAFAEMAKRQLAQKNDIDGYAVKSFLSAIVSSANNSMNIFNEANKEEYESFEDGVLTGDISVEAWETIQQAKMDVDSKKR